MTPLTFFNGFCFPKPSKFIEKSIQKSIKKLIKFCIDLLIIFETFWLPKSIQKWYKILLKINKKSMQNLINFLIDFWIDFLMNFQCFGKQKSLKNVGGVIKFEICLFLVEHQFLIDFWSIFGAKMSPKMIKNPSKKQSKKWIIF